MTQSGRRYKAYRFSSQLIPLGNHPLGQIWDFTEVLREELIKIGQIVMKMNYGLAPIQVNILLSIPTMKKPWKIASET